MIDFQIKESISIAAAISIGVKLTFLSRSSSPNPSVTSSLIVQADYSNYRVLRSPFSVYRSSFE